MIESACPAAKTLRSDDRAVVDRVADREVDAGAAADVANRREAVTQHQLGVANAVIVASGTLSAVRNSGTSSRCSATARRIGDMRVAVDQSRHDRRIAEIDDVRPAARVTLMHRNDPVAGHDQQAGRAIERPSKSRAALRIVTPVARAARGTSIAIDAAASAEQKGASSRARSASLKTAAESGACGQRHSKLT